MMGSKFRTQLLWFGAVMFIIGYFVQMLVVAQLTYGEHGGSPVLAMLVTVLVGLAGFLIGDMRQRGHR